MNLNSGLVKFIFQLYCGMNKVLAKVLFIAFYIPVKLCGTSYDFDTYIVLYTYIVGQWMT